MKNDRNLPWLTIILLLLPAVAFFIYRGPFRGVRGDAFDFTGPYASARAWLERLDPYDRVITTDVMARSTGDPASVITAPAYLPGTFPILAPFAALPWQSASVIWVIFLTACYLTAATLIAVAADLHNSRFLLLVYAVIVLLFAPIQTGLTTANPGVASGCLALCAVVLSMNPRTRAQLAAGVVMGIAITIKIQLALPIWLYLIATRRWKSATIAVAVRLVIFVVMAWDVSRLNDVWFDHMRLHIANMPGLQVGGDSIERFGRLHLGTLIMFFNENVSTSRLISISFLCLPGFYWLLLVWKKSPDWIATRNKSPELMAITPLLAMDLLVVYHRPYDAVILLPAVAWVVCAIGRRPVASAAPAKLAGVMLLAFVLVPWATVLMELVRRNIIPPAISGNVVFQFLVMANPTWALLGLTAAGIWALSENPVGRETKPTTATPA